MKKKYLLPVSLISMLLFITGFIFVYANDYYHALPSSNDALITDEKVSVTIEEDQITFNPSTPSGTGIIFYPGGKVEYTAYAPLIRELAENDITCVLMRMPLNLAVFGVNKADNAMSSNPQINDWYIAGHSLGGAMASSYALKNYSSLKGIIFLGAYSSSDLSNTSLSMLSLYGSADKVLNRENFEKIKTNSPKDSTYYEISGGNHAYFGLYGEQAGDGIATINTEEQRKITVDTMIEFIKQH